MPDCKRLGTRGAGAVPVRWWLVSCAVAAAVLGLGASLFGLWWLPFVAGVIAGATARVVAALAGLPALAAAGIAGTLLIALLQALAAFWLTRALRPR